MLRDSIMKRNIVLILFTIIFASTLDAQQLVILHTNDTHSQIESFRTGRNKDLAGVERRLQLFNQEVEKYGKKNVLILDAGDYNQGTPYFTVGKGDLEVDLMNIMGYDAVALGNHEFDNGQEELARRLKSTKYKSLCANYDFTGTPLEGLIEPYTIIKKAGVKIGIIGVTTNLKSVVSAAAVRNLERLNTIEVVNKLAEELKVEKGCDLVILLSHLGYSDRESSLENPSDNTVAANSRHIDYIVGGHSHTFLKEAVDVENLDGKMVPIVQTGAHGIYVGKFVIEF